MKAASTVLILALLVGVPQALAADLTISPHQSMALKAPPVRWPFNLVVASNNHSIVYMMINQDGSYSCPNPPTKAMMAEFQTTIPAPYLMAYVAACGKRLPWQAPK